MGLKLTRKKNRNLKLSFAYKFFKLLPYNAKGKLKLFLDLSWIFSRLAHEQTFKAGIVLPQNDEVDIISSFIEKDSSVLDIGCNTGLIVKRILSKTKNIVGVDLYKPFILSAQKEFANTGAQFLCDDILDYFKKNDSVKFDYIIMSHILEHIDNPLDFLLSLKNRAKYFYIEIPDFEAIYLNLFRREVQTDLIYTDEDHVSEFDRRELETMFSACQFEVIKAEFRYGVMSYWCKQKEQN